jgi:probable HAF family extracellular repeat protein
MLHIHVLGKEQERSRRALFFGAVVAALITMAAPARTQAPWIPTDLGTLGGAESHALDVNDAGQVVGYSTFSGSGVFHAFLWTQGGGIRDRDVA